MLQSPHFLIASLIHKSMLCKWHSDVHLGNIWFDPKTVLQLLCRNESWLRSRFQLKELVKEQLEADAILENQSMEDDIVFRVSLRELEESVRRMGVEDVMPFLESTMFKDNRFTYDPQTRMITRVFAHNAD